MDIWRSLAGELEVELICAQPQELLSKLNSGGIEVYRIEWAGELTCRFVLHRNNYHDAKRITQRNGGSLQPRNSHGLFFRVKKLLERPVLSGSILIMLLLVLVLPTRVLFVEVEGNQRIPAKRILEAASESGIRFGATRRHVRSEQVKNALLDAIPELQWAGVNTKGCVAILSVRERTPEEKLPENEKIQSMVAQRDGYILSATATKGDLLVQSGQSVVAGDILISGYRDLGLFLQATGAEGEVYAQTSRMISVITPSKWQEIRGINSVKKKYSLLIGKKRINLWKDSGISDVTCGRMYEEYYVTLPGGFKLPIALCMELFQELDAGPASIEVPDPIPAMGDYASKYLLSQMVAGEIRKSSEQWLLTDSLLILQETCVCHEMIGRLRQEQIGDIHE